jgi:sarcosine oxidase, subunit gamma
MADPALRRAPAIQATAWLRPLPPATRLILHGGVEARRRAAVAWEAPFSEVPCRAGVQGNRATLWMGPDEYLLIDTGTAAPAPLAGALQGVAHALVDVSHRQIALEIHGPHAAAILNGGCPLDLDPVAFPVGMCTRTLCGKADIVLWRTSADTFHVEVWRSFTEYLVALLGEVARDIAG